MFEYHDEEKQVAFLKRLMKSLKRTEDRSLMKEIIHDLQEPFQSVCLDEAEYRLNEVAEQNKVPGPTMEEIADLAERLYDSELFLNGDVAEHEAEMIYDESIRVIDGLYPTNIRHKCSEYSDDTHMVRISSCGYDCVYCGISFKDTESQKKLLEMCPSPVKVYFPETLDIDPRKNIEKAMEIVSGYGTDYGLAVEKNHVTLMANDITGLNKVVAAMEEALYSKNLENTEDLSCSRSGGISYRIPCHIGDVLYFLWEGTPLTETIIPCKVDEFSITKQGLRMHLVSIHDMIGHSEWHDCSEIGKTLFFSKEDAKNRPLL